MALFAPFRALGYITDPVPFATQRRGGGSGGGLAGGGRDGRGSGATVTVAVGRTWQTYDSSRLVLRLVGPAHPRDVTAVACKGDLTWAAAGGDIYEARRVHFTTSEGAAGDNADGSASAAKPAYRGGHRAGSRVIALMALGEGDAATLLSLGTDRQLLAWRVGRHGRKPAARIDLSAAAAAGAEVGGAANGNGSGIKAASKKFAGDPSARPTCMCHPDTYLNKVVVGFTDGTLRLYNYATGRHLYTFDVAGGAGGAAAFGGAFGGGRASASANRASIRCVAASPALDVVGCGLSDGRVIVHHLRRDARVVEFEAAAGGAGAAGADEDGGNTTPASAAAATAAGGMLSLLDRGAGLGSTAAATSTLATSGAAITALCFRPGAAGGAAAVPPLPLLAVGGGAGGIAFWDLEKRRLHAVLRDAHDAPVVSLHWFPGEPRVMSSGADNAIKQWSLDGSEAVPRLLRFRGGHSSPPTVVAHYGPGGLRLLSAGADRAFRVFSTIQDQQSRELGQGGAGKRARRRGLASEAEAKLPRISALGASDARERDWSNVVTAHEGDPRAYTWRLAHFTLGEAVLQPTPTALRVVNAGGGRLAAGAAAAPVSAVAVTPCGNFAVVGSAAGRVDRYNLQSGLHRGGFYRRRRRDKFGLAGERHPPLMAPMPGEEAAAAAAAAGRALLMLSSSSAAAAAAGGGAGSDDDGGDGNKINIKKKGRRRGPLSGASRYRPRPTDEVRGAHDGAVVGCGVDARGRLLVTAGADGFVRVWDFRRQQLVAEAYAGAPIARMAMHPGTGLVAVALAGPVQGGAGGGGAGGAAGGGAAPSPSSSSSSASAFPYALRVFDAEAGARLVRRFPGHADRVTALQLSADGRWLLSAGMDGALRVWDLPSGACAQAMAVAGPPITALSLSPALDLLATAHANRRGVFLWANQALFGDPTAVARLEASAGAEALAGGGGRTRAARAAWERLVPVGMPSIGTGHEREEDEGGRRKKNKGGAEKEDDDEDESSESESDSDDDSSAGGMSASDLSSSSDYAVGHLVGKRRAGVGGDNEDDDDDDDDDDAAAAAAAAPPLAHEARDPSTGAPRPLAPRLATLSLLPRAQVDSLLHLDAIRARGRPLAPPKKPEAAPFFLPTVPSLAGHPVFGGDGGSGGGGGGGEEDEGEEAAAGGGGSRVKRARLAAAGGGPGKHEPPPSSEFVRLLREGERRQHEAGAAKAAAAAAQAGGAGRRGSKKAVVDDDDDAEEEAGDNPYAPFIAYALSLTPVALDSELRALALLDVPADGEGGDGDDSDDGPSPMAERETADLLALLTALDLELATARNYEFCNAVLARALALHGDALAARPRLVAACAALRARLKAGWRALDTLLQGVRCMADFFAGAQ